MADIDTLNEDEFLFAGELALGVLEGPDWSNAKQRQLADLAFAEAVEWWEERLARMAEEVGEFAPANSVLTGIHARIDALEDGGSARVIPMDETRKGPAKWSVVLAAFGTAMAAAALVLYISVPAGSGTIDPVQQGPASAKLVAQLQDEAGGRKLAGIIDPEMQRLTINVSGLEADSGKITELWVIPADGVPRSLGKIPGTGSFERELTDGEALLLTEGSALAVTFEIDDGLPHEAPTMPILVVGALDKV